MPLSAGDKLGPYEILAPLGAGGMGEVYRARDTKLNREVAIKVLPDSLAHDPDRLARFEREARVLASLNHPNIAQIYGIQERALVMELVAGETLKGPLPLATVLDYAKQIAQALEAAHERGIVHRDLKPANVMITAAGLVKVLDFGLATVLQGSIPGGDPTNSPTVTMQSTQAHMIMGTAAYMSPEQAAGKPVDRRADIWSYGVVLWETLSGQRLFSGETISHTLADVLRAPIDFDKLPPETPRPIRELLKRCLDRDAKKRLRDIGEARIVIENWGKEPEVAATGAGTTSPSGRLHSKLAWLAAGVMMAVAAVSLWAPWSSAPPTDRPLVRLDVDLGSNVSLPAPTNGGGSVAISPDATRLAYASGTPTRLFTRRLDQPNATELPGTQGATRPFFSPDGEWVGFLSGTRLNKISVEGGAVVLLGDIANFAGASWGEDGSIVVGDALGKGLVRIPAGGGPPETIAGLEHGEGALALPQILPGGKAVLFAAVTALDVDGDTIEVLTLADRRRKIVARGGQSPRYLPTSNGGYLVYVNKTTLFAIPFDLQKLETRGTAVPVLDDVAYESRTGTAQLDFSRNGALIYRRVGTGVAAATSIVQWVNSAGNREPLLTKSGAYSDLSLSPDGKRIAMLVADGGQRDVWVYDQQRDTMTRLTFGGPFIESPIWTPDGQYVIFGRVNNGIYFIRSDGAGQPQALIESRKYLVPMSLTPDGKRLAYFDVRGGEQIWTVPLAEEGGQLKAGKPEQFLKTSFVDTDPAFSPDGRWLAYRSNESGKNEVYVRAFPPPSSGQGGKWQVSNNGGTLPRWSRSGHDLLYQSGDQIMATNYTVKGDTFVVDKPRVWLAKLGGTEWDLAPDGKRVSVLTPVESAEAPKQEHEVVFLQNFFDELRRRVPLSK